MLVLERSNSRYSPLSKFEQTQRFGAKYKKTPKGVFCIAREALSGRQCDQDSKAGARRREVGSSKFSEENYA